MVYSLCSLALRQGVKTELGLTTLVEVLQSKARERGDKTAFTELSEEGAPDSAVTFAQLDRMARGVAAQLQEAGTAGRRALLLYPPGIAFVGAFLGCLYAGVVAVASSPPHPSRPDRHTTARLLAILNDARPALVLTVPALEPRVRTLLAETGADARCLVPVLDGAGAAPAWSPPPISPDTLAFLQYTSGTTGAPKGVPITHGNLMRNLQMMEAALGITDNDSGVNWLPPFHDMGLIGGLLQPIYQGSSVALLSPVSFLQRPFRWLETMSRLQATVSGGPDFAYDLCARRITPEQKALLDLSRWRIALNGSEPIRPVTLAAFEAAFAPCGFSARAWSPCYGLAEATLFVSGGPRGDNPLIRRFHRERLEQNAAVGVPEDDPAGRDLASSGPPAEGLHVEIVPPETRASCPPGTIGEIWLQGPSVAEAYWDNEPLTETAFRAPLAEGEDDSFFRTGDLGFLHRGELYVTGRLQDRIVIGERAFPPQDMEETAETSHPALRQGGAAVFATETGLVILCEVERQALSKLDPEAVIGAIRQQVQEEYGLVPQAVGLLKPGALPRTTSGKIQRRACHDLYRTDGFDLIAQDTHLTG